MYRGEHHPTDVLGSLLFSALWLTATTLLIKPNADGRERAPVIGRGRVAQARPAEHVAGPFGSKIT
jgi:membrane-associated phospholipid phosphatase